MKEIQSFKGLDLEDALEEGIQFVGREEVEAERRAAAISQFHLAPIPPLIMAEPAHVADRGDKSRRHAPNRPDGRDETAARDAPEFPGDRRKFRKRNVAEHAVEAQRKVDAVVRLRKGMGKVADREFQPDAGKRREAAAIHAGLLDLLGGNIESAGRDLDEAHFPGADHQTLQPCAGAASRVENAEGGCPRQAYLGQLGRDARPDLAVRVAVRAAKAEQIRRIAIRVAAIGGAGQVVGFRHGRCANFFADCEHVRPPSDRRASSSSTHCCHGRRPAG